MLAGSGSENANNVFMFDKNKILKSAVIYGANGAGKTNFVKSLIFLKHLVTKSHTFSPEMKIQQYQHKLFLENDTEFYIQFVSIKGIRFAYGLSFKEKVSKEYLYYFPNGRQTKIFERNGNTVKAGAAFIADVTKVAMQFLKPNRLFMSCLANFSNIESITDAYMFFSKTLKIYGDEFYDENGSWIIYSAKKASQNAYKEKFELFFKAIGNQKFTDVISKVSEYKFNEKNVPNIFTEKVRNSLINRVNLIPEIRFGYGKYYIPIEHESEGNRRLFELFFPLLDTIENNYVFVCDEFESHFHQLITKKIVELFNSNSKNAQLIITSHDTSLINVKVFRRDQIWFADNDNDFRSTTLYSLSEIRGIRKDEAIMNNYKSGKYSGIPKIDGTYSFGKIDE